MPDRLPVVGTCCTIALLFATAGLLALSGCAHPSKWGAGESPIAADVEPFTEEGEVRTPDRWWMALSDANLDHHVNRALDQNYTLAAALHRLRAARALARRVSSDLCPDLNGVVGWNGVFSNGDERTTTTWGLDAAYQVDLWGEIQSRASAERLRANATGADYQAVGLTLSGEIARTWFALIEAHAQVELLAEQIETNRIGLTLQESRFGLGLIRSADVLRQRQLLESTLEQEVVVKSRVELLEHQLAVLLGEAPQTATYETGTVLPELPPLPLTGLPSELVRRRPDVRAVFLAMCAADADLASAVSAQYPRINLTGALLNSVERPEDLFDRWFLSIGGQLIAPLFDGGQRRAEVDRTSAVVEQLFNEYGQVILTAFREVEDSLAAERYQRDRIKHLEAQVEYAGESSEQLRAQYLIGDAEYLDVLSAITGQQSLQRRLLSARLELILIRVSLYLALAGDFDLCSQLETDRLPVVEDEKVKSTTETSSDAESNTVERLPNVEAAPESEPLPAPKE